MTIICISCGMPMTATSDHACGDSSLAYCRHCANTDGRMATFEQTSRRLADRLQRTGLSEGEALRSVVERLMELPAWRTSR